MELSYWEYTSWLSNVDHVVVGSGIVGLNCALRLKQRFPKSKVIVLEKGIFPQGASTKNAGFACFGSISEILSDLEHHSEEEMVALVKKRYEGIQQLRSTIGDNRLRFQCHGGHEVFLKEDAQLFDHCSSKLNMVNTLLTEVFGKSPYKIVPNEFAFEQVVPQYITHLFEGQIDTGEMMMALVQKAQKAGIVILNSIKVERFEDVGEEVIVQTQGFTFTSKNLLLAVNGFANQLMQEAIAPARAQVLLTKPIDGLHIKGTFHLDKGYYYFRNINGRILLGGGRNLDFKGEETTLFGHTKRIQTRLEELIATVILPNIPFEIDQRWSGIMGVGPQKKPIVRALSNRVFCGVRLGGMGVALGSSVGHDLADLID